MSQTIQHYSLNKDDEDQKDRVPESKENSMIQDDQEETSKIKNVNKNPEPYLKNQRTALSKEFSCLYSFCMVTFLLFNTAIVLASHLGSSFLIRTSLDDSETEVFGACTNNDDESVLTPGSEALDESSSYLNQFVADCGTPTSAACLEEFIADRFGLTFECSNCIALYGVCLIESCNEDCFVDPVDTLECEICSDLFCEFTLESCTGINFLQDTLEDSCVNEKDNQIFVEGSEALDEITTYLPEIGIFCFRQELDQQTCVKQEVINKFDTSDDCSTCSFILLDCIQDSCVSECVVGDLPLPGCEACLLSSGCAQQYETCTGLDAFSNPLASLALPSLTTDLCNNPQDLTVFVEDSEALTQSATYVPGIAFSCFLAQDQRPQCISEGVEERFNVTQPCSSCFGSYGACLQISCQSLCFGQAADPAECEVCANNVGCEFEFEKCTGIDFVEDSNIDACINEVDNAIFVSDSAALDDFPTYVTEAVRTCQGDSLCIQEELLTDFSMTEDCSSCLVNLGLCMAQVCAPNCFGPNTEGCESCLVQNGCADSLTTCSGIDFVNPGGNVTFPTVEPVANLCDNEDDLAILVDGSAALTQTSSYVPQFGGLCFQEGNANAECVADKVSQTFGLSPLCSSCSGDYAFCLLPSPECGSKCIGAEADPAACEECANDFGCEFEFEKCSGVNYVEDNDIDACVNDVDSEVFTQDSAALTQVTTYIPTILRSCGSDATCTQEALLDQFSMTEDCSSCLVNLGRCMSTQCAAACFGAGIPLETCEPCLASSPCSSELETCSGLDFFGDPVVTEAPTTVELSFSEDGTCLGKDQFEIFDSREITFFFAVERTIESGAYALAFVLGAASGVWPYLKNMLMAYTWFGNLTQRKRDIILRCLAVLGKWSFVDVFAVILIADGITLQYILTRSGLPFVIFAEPRAGIYWFGLAAFWALAQGEVIRYFEKTHLRQRKIQDGGSLIANVTEQEKNISYFKVVLGLAAGVSLVCSIAGVFLPNLKMTVLGKIRNNEGPDESVFNVFELAAALADSCALHENHGSQPGAFFLAALLVLLVVVIPILTCILMLRVAVTFHPSRSDNFFIGFSFGLGNFACLDVWFISLYVFSNQFESLVSGALGDSANQCAITQDEINSGIVCVGLRGETESGGFFLGAAAFTFWIAQYAAVKLMQNSFKFVGTYVEYDQSV